MMAGWRCAKLVEIAAKKRWALNGGPFGSKLTTKHYMESGVPVIRGTNLSGDSRFSFDDFVWVSEGKADELLPNNAHPGDLVFTQRGTIGQVGLIPTDAPFKRFVISQSQMKLTPDSGQADPLYLYYYFSAPDTVKRIENLAFSAGVPHINLTILRNLEVPVPPLAIQRRIAGILTAYDELIENNQRRIQILEEMARALYREWFVHFRFPGHQSHPPVASPLGEIPVEWSVRRLDELAVVTMGSSPKGDTYNESANGIPLVNGPVEFGDRFAKRVKWTTAATNLCNEGDLIVCVRGSTTGRSVTSDGVYCLGRGVCAISSEFQCFVDLLFATELPTLLAQAGGSTFPSWTGPQLKSYQVIAPTRSILAQFESRARPMRDAIDCYWKQIDNLRATRDLLLPRLLSGQIDLAAAEL